MSWEDQGRQYHEWFGHGTANHPAETGGGAAPKNLPDRAQSVAFGMVAALPPAMRGRIATQQHDGDAAAVQTRVLTAWAKASHLYPETFAHLLLGRPADDQVAFLAHAVGKDLHQAGSNPRDLQRASISLAEIAKTVGPDRFARFMQDADQRARDPAIMAALAPPGPSSNPQRDAIRPVYPIETILGGGETLLAGGLKVAARFAGKEIVKQSLRAGKPGGKVANAEGENVDNPAAHTETSGAISYPKNPDDLLQQGWTEISHPRAVLNGRRTFFSRRGEIMHFDEGDPKQTGFAKVDHYHRPNSNEKGKLNAFLDRNGNPVPRGSKASHIVPEDQ